MKKTLIFSLLVLATAVALMPSHADATNRRRSDRVAMYNASRQPWHDHYYHTSYGQPIALVVPPTANSQVDWGWGVTQSEIRPINHQFMRPYGGDVDGGGEYSPFQGTPPWPSHTRQFGVYYIRGPW